MNINKNEIIGNINTKKNKLFSVYILYAGLIGGILNGSNFEIKNLYSLNYENKKDRLIFGTCLRDNNLNVRKYSNEELEYFLKSMSIADNNTTDNNTTDNNTTDNNTTDNNTTDNNTTDNNITDNNVDIIKENSIYVSTDNLNVRKKTSLKSKSLFKLSKGEKINYIDTIIDNGFVWKKIDIGGNEYFVAEKNLKNNKKYLLDNIEESIEKEKGYSIKIDKSDRKLIVFKGGEIEKEFNMSISGIDENEPKKTEGDMKTPEGKYFVSYKNKVSSFGTNPENGGRLGSLLVSYPNIHDAWNGLNNNIIDIKEYNSIYNSIKTKGVPSQYTALGSWIMIHGGGSDGDWTAGCIALDDKDMLWVNNNIKSGVNIDIVQ